MIYFHFEGGDSQRNGDCPMDCDRLKTGDHQMFLTIRRLLIGHCLDCPKDGACPMNGDPPRSLSLF